MLYSCDTVRKPHAFSSIPMSPSHTLHVHWLIPPTAPNIHIPGKALEAHLPSRGWPTESTSCCISWSGTVPTLIWYGCAYSFSGVRLFVTLWTAVRQAPLSMGFSRQVYWSGVPFPPPGDLPDPGMEPVSLMSPALESGFFTTSTTWEAWVSFNLAIFEIY